MYGDGDLFFIVSSSQLPSNVFRRQVLVPVHVTAAIDSIILLLTVFRSLISVHLVAFWMGAVIGVVSEADEARRT